MSGFVFAALASNTARADDAADKDRARALYKEGVVSVEKTQWSDALLAFESSAKIYPTPVTTLAIGSCERALGRYVRARSTLQRSLDESAISE